jgi:glucosamine kinase
MTRIVVGIDGGGTNTRAMTADTGGRVLAYVEAGGTNPSHAPRAAENAAEVLRQVLLATGCQAGQIAGLVAGFAGLDSPEDQAWAEQFTELPGMHCPRLHVNDAVIAHAGPLRSQPGIVAISGTGSIVFGVTPDGRSVRNYDFHHYAPTAARYLSYDTVFRIIAGETGAADRDFVETILDYWEAPDLAALAALGARGFIEDDQERKYRFGGMAGRVTRAAADGVPVARAVCDRAAAALSTGIRLVGACFPEDPVLVALVGSVARSPYVFQAVEQALAQDANRVYCLVHPALSPVQGAVLMALERAGVAADEALLKTLAESTQAMAPEQSQEA